MQRESLGIEFIKWVMEGKGKGGKERKGRKGEGRGAAVNGSEEGREKREHGAGVSSF